MTKCTNECPEKKHDGCCCECPHAADCESKCSSTPDMCEDAVFEGTDLEVFNNKAAAVIKRISNITSQKKQLEEAEKEMKEQLQKAMEQYGIKSFDNDVIKVTYVDASTRNSVDSAKLKKNYPDIAAECSKTSNVKAYVKVEVKGGDKK